MKTLVLSFSLFLSSFAFSAQAPADESAPVIVPAQSCHQDYIKRRNQLTRNTIVTPLVAAVAIPAFAIGALIVGTSSNGGVTIGEIVDVTHVGAIVGLVGVVGFEALYITQLVKVNAIAKLIEESHQGEGKRLNRYARKMSKKLDREVTSDEIAEAISKADMSGILCDGSMRGKKANSKLRKRLARAKEIKAYLQRALE